jgi:hypothetical protein
MSSPEQLRACLASLECEGVQLEARQLLDAESILENASNGFLVCDSEFQVTCLSGDYEPLLGKPGSQLPGKTQPDVYPKTIGPEIDLPFRRAMKDRVGVIFDCPYPPTDPFFLPTLFDKATTGKTLRRVLDPGNQT